MNTDSSVIVVGAGVFGLSTALELTRKGYKNVTIVDRHVPPVRTVDKSEAGADRTNRYQMAPVSTSHV